jgi:hypothetical protein
VLHEGEPTAADVDRDACAAAMMTTTTTEED